MAILIILIIFALALLPLWFPKFCDLLIDKTLKKDIDFVVKNLEFIKITGIEDALFVEKMSEITSNKKKISAKENFIIALNYFEEALVSKPALNDLKIQYSKSNDDSLRKLIELRSKVNNKSWLFYQSHSATMLMCGYLWAANAFRAK